MSNDKKTAIQFLKELDADIEDMLNQAVNLELLAVRIFNRYDEFVEANMDITRSEAFRALEKDVKSMYQTCRFVSKDAIDVRHSIAACSTELN